MTTRILYILLGGAVVGLILLFALPWIGTLFLPEERSSGTLFLEVASSADTPDERYLVGEFKNLSARLASDWTVRTDSWKQKLPSVTPLPLPGDPHVLRPLLLEGSGTLVVSPGRSPLGTSFQVNACSGYLEQYQNFVPPLETSCPSPKEIVTYFSPSLSPECASYLETAPACVHPEDLSSIPAACQVTVTKSLTYSGCVEATENTPDFLKKEWRIYFEDTTKTFAPSGTISITDGLNRLVSTFSY